MELKFNEAKIVRPNHLERCLCYDKFLKGYRCYVYDDISKYWCTQATTEHDPNGDNHIVDYADYQVTKWASLQQKQPETPSGEEVMTMCNQILIDWVKEGKTPEEREQRERAHIRFFELYDEYMQEQPEVDLDAEIAIYLNRNVLNRINYSDIIEDFTTMEAGELAEHFYELGLNARKEE